MINEGYYERLAQIESGNNPKAKNPKSTASGLYQFTKATAEQYGLDDPFDEKKARIAVEQFTKDNYNSLQSKLGRVPTEGELYLAHQQGAGGALKLLQNPSRNAVDVVGLDQVINNGGTEGMTAKEFAAKWTGKFGSKQEGATVSAPSNDIQLEAEGSLPTSTVTMANSTEAPTYQKTIQLPDGREIGLTGSETPDQLLRLKVKLAETYNSSIALDRETGAHPAVRSFVGSVYDQEDKLNSLRKYYPDAIPYGEDNYVFTSPETGKLTLYNPKGLDLGDVTSVTREAFQIVGSGVGAAVGAGLAGLAGQIPPFTATPEEAVTVPAAAIAGSGVGMAATGSAFDWLMSSMGLTYDTRTMSEKVTDFATEAAIGAAGEGVGRAVSAGSKAGWQYLKGALGGGSPASQKLLQGYLSFNIKPSAALVTAERGFSRFEQGLQQSPIAAEIMIKSADDVLKQTKSALDEITTQIGRPLSKQGTGETIKQAAINAAERFGFRQEKLYQEAFDLIGADTLVDVASVKVLRREILDEIARSPKTLKPILGESVKLLDNIVADAEGGGIPFSSLRQIRTSVGQDLNAPLLAKTTGAQNEVLKRVYGALTEDLGGAAASVSAEASKKIKTADRYTRSFMQNSQKLLQKIANFDADEKAYGFAITAAKDGGTTLRKLRNNFLPEEWDTISASVLEKLGYAAPGAQTAAGDAFSINTFLTNWNRLAPEAKDALFGGARYKPQREALDKLTGLMDKIKDTSRFTNTSNTAGALQSYYLLSGILGAGVGGAASGDAEGALKGAGVGLGAVLSARASARLLTSPKFVEWLAEPMANKAGFSASAHMAKLLTIAEGESALRDDIESYIKNMNLLADPE